jgi:hypothetical protein
MKTIIILISAALLGQPYPSKSHTPLETPVETTLKKAVNWVPLKLLNNSLKSIPLEIPGVMNPNLNPLSESNVSIPQGTVIYFFVKKKKYPLLTVSSDLNKEIIVDEVIKKRKIELGLSKE